VPTVVFAGSMNPLAEPSDYRRAARMFQNDYIVRRSAAAISCTGSIPRPFAERLLIHL